jgi:hypothetical protein
MTYNNPKFYDFNYGKLNENIEYIFDCYGAIIDNSKVVEKKLTSIQENFDINHPNVTFFAGNLQYDSDTSTFAAKKTYSSLITGVGLFSSSPHELSDDNSLIPRDQKSSSINHLSKLFLSKNEFTHHVDWGYLKTLSSEVFSGDEIPGYTYMVYNFHSKRFPMIPMLNISKCTEENHITNYSYFNTYVNRRDAENVRFRSDSIVVGLDAFYLNNLPSDFSVDTLISSHCSIVPGTNEYDIATDESLNDIVVSKNLSNATDLYTNFMSQYDEKADDKVVSINELNNYVEDILERKTTEFSDEFGAIHSASNDAYTWREMYEYISLKISVLYTKTLFKFIETGTENPDLYALFMRVKSLIERLKKDYVRNDECSNKTPNNIDESCIVRCENIDLSERNLMVSKQKMISSIRCALSCDR